MPLFISNFKKRYAQKVVSFEFPVKFVFLFLILAIFFWELFWRGQGFVPTHNDSKDLWIENRKQNAINQKNTIIITGSSRVLFGINKRHLQKISGRPVVQLAINGSSPLPVLEDLAGDAGVKGFIICGVSPLYFFDLSTFYTRSFAYIQYSHKRTFSNRMSHSIGFQLEKFFVYPSQKELFFQLFIQAAMQTDRQIKYSVKIPENVTYQTIFFAGDRFTYTPEILLYSKIALVRLKKKFASEVKAPDIITAADLDTFYQRIQNAVTTLQKRGSRVVFLRMPVNGVYLAREKKHWPREKYWERLLESTPATRIHFEDYKSLQQFQCPDGSHLTKKDAIRYTDELVRILDLDK